MQIHVYMSFPQKGMWHLSSWTSSIWDPWVFSLPGNLSLPLNNIWEISLPPLTTSGILETFSPPLVCSLSPTSFDVISLFPFDINFQEGLSGIRRIGLVLETQHKAKDKIVMLVEDKIHWVELDQKKCRTSGKLFFWLQSRWHRVAHFGGTEKIQLDRKLQVGETEFTQRKTLVTSAH